MTRSSFTPRVLGLILARGGSKRLPGKNIRSLAGKPLLAWSVDASRACAATDSQAIAEVALKCGARVPFMRPAPLAGDSSTSTDAALHALDWLRDEEGEQFDALVLLEPTSPLRASGDLDAVLELLARRWDETDAVVSVGQVQLEQPEVMKLMSEDGYLSPWAAPQPGLTQRHAALFPYGVAYAVKVSALRRWSSFYPPRVLGYPIQRWQNYEVDDEFDFLCIEAIVNHFKGQLP
jgi:CMP-N,N'-diacetyllegionaminic acid synthase